MKDRSSHTIWVEKYRPTTLEGYVGNDLVKSKINEYIEKQDIPHLFFHGKAGTGKTTVAKILVNNIDCDYLFINASAENNVDTVRNKITTFASTMSFKPLKIIVLDEADYITPNAQAALRNLMEAYSSHTRFILTANYKERIIDPIISRTQSFDLFPPSKAEVAKNLAWILDQENVSYDLKDLAVLIHAYYPDIRKITGTAQLQTSNGSLKIDLNQIEENDYKTKVLSIISKSGSVKEKFTNIRQTIADAKITDFSDLYRMLFDKVDEYGKGHISAIILAIAEGAYRESMVVDKEINVIATIVNILQIMNG